MLILGVLDVMRGEVVRGVGGRREEYRPIQSILVPSSRPADVADAFRSRSGINALYIADLDAIAGEPPAVHVYHDLQSRGFDVWVDAGLRTAAEAAPLAEAGVSKFVAGLETLASPDALTDISTQYGPDRVVFSLDLRAGEPLGYRNAWRNAHAFAIATRVTALGVRRMILLDLARVGMGAGTGTEELLTRLAASCPEVDWIVGGGIRNAEDVKHLKTCGASGVLLASALHDGRITREDLETL